MATGLPVVATRVDAIPEVIQHDINGILVEKGDASALAEGIERLILDPAMRQRLGSKALHDVRSLFSIENTTQLYAEYLGIV
jgi:glycosyltransferase involved in cell wall biosynthesis